VNAIEHVLVATDFGSSSLRAVRFAAELSAQLRARLSVIHVIPESTPVVPVEGQDERERAIRHELDRFLESLEKTELPCEGVVRFGDPACEVVGFAGESTCDLIVVGTHGRAGLSRFLLGSVAERILRSSSVPVLVVRESPE
jgi:nucleotide-binding universal stress UspA family protein